MDRANRRKIRVDEGGVNGAGAGAGVGVGVG